MDTVKKLIEEAKAKAQRETENAPSPQYIGSVDFPVDCKVDRGLEGAIACDTQIGYVNGLKGWLIYRGYNIFDLAEHSTFEETAYLLVHGHLPKKSELDAFNDALISRRALAPVVIEVLQRTPTATCHPMSALRTAVSVLGMFDNTSEETTVEAETAVALKLIACFPTLAGAIARIRAGQPVLEPRSDLSHAANLLYLMTGKEPDPQMARIMDVALILHADHGMNASTFTTMVANSSLADMYGSIVAGIASLKGPLHGGANERVLYDLEEIGSPDNVDAWFDKAKGSHRKVMGFGHRVYKAYDPRARILRPLAALLAEQNPEIEKLDQVAIRLDARVSGELGAKKHIFPNVDFYSGLVYKAMGVETAMFTPIFAVSRIAGWTARALEYLGQNRIFRPRAVYTGPTQSEYLPIEKR